MLGAGHTLQSGLERVEDAVDGEHCLIHGLRLSQTPNIRHYSERADNMPLAAFCMCMDTWAHVSKKYLPPGNGEAGMGQSSSAGRRSPRISWANCLARRAGSALF